MTMYNLLFGKNPQAAMLLAVLGIKEHEVPRFRDVHADEDGKTIEIYTRMGGGNRGHWDGYDGDGGPDCPCPGCRAEHFLTALPGYQGNEDDDFDCTYATYRYAVAEEWQGDVVALRDLLTHGLRPEFGNHLARTLRREPTEADKADQAHDAERGLLARTSHLMANGHTFVPLDDGAMETALEAAEKNGGELRSCWGILPIALVIKTNDQPWPKAKDPDFAARITRAEINYSVPWRLDEEYWEHCRKRFEAKFPKAMAKIAEGVERNFRKEPA